MRWNQDSGNESGSGQGSSMNSLGFFFPIFPPLPPFSRLTFSLFPNCTQNDFRTAARIHCRVAQQTPNRAALGIVHNLAYHILSAGGRRVPHHTPLPRCLHQEIALLRVYLLQPGFPRSRPRHLRGHLGQISVHRH